MRVLVIGDPHFKIKNGKETKAMHKAILREIKNKQPNFVVVAGDVLDRHETIHVDPLCRSIKFLKDLTDLAKVYLIIGNHDRKNNKDFLSEEHPFTAVKMWNNIEVIDIVKVTNENGFKFIFVPYVEPGRFEEALKTNDDNFSDATAIFAHQEFFGCSMGAIKSTIGDKWPLEYPLVISGHIHDYQEVQANIFYVGTPIQHGFGDSDQKTISLFDFIENNFNHTRIDLKLRKKKIIYLSVDDINTFEPPEKYDLKIVIRGLNSEIKSIKNHENIVLWKEAGHKVIFKDTQLLIPSDTNNSYFPNSSEPTNPKKSFIKILYRSVRKDEKLSKCFVEVFGGKPGKN